MTREGYIGIGIAVGAGALVVGGKNKSFIQIITKTYFCLFRTYCCCYCTS
jgi:hypothetical protein